MRYIFTLLASLALAGRALSQTAAFDTIVAPTYNENFTAGSSLNIVWEPGSQTGTITITLLHGAAASQLQLGPVIACKSTNFSSLIFQPKIII